VVGREFLSFGGSSPPDVRVDCGGLVGVNGGDAAGDLVCPCNRFFVVGMLEWRTIMVIGLPLELVGPVSVPPSEVDWDSL
jgi:hypothetical protein